MLSRVDRGRFEGVVKIIRFNARYYVGAIAVPAFALALLFAIRLPLWLRAAAISGVTLVLFWTVMSLAVSWYVYDHAGVTRWEWMLPDLQHAPARWANIHAGFDESTAALRHMLPGTDGVAIDIYDPALMTEPSIARARSMYPSAEPFEAGSYGALPLPDTDRDAIFLLFAAHELRSIENRTTLLRESSRVLKQDGRVLLVEHLRDLPNFLAFGPGFLHFHGARSWQRSIADAGLQVAEQRNLTAFVRCFTLQKADA